MAQAERLNGSGSRGARWEVDHEVVAQASDGRACTVRIANLSNGGFMAESDRPLSIGSILTLEVPGEGKVEAEIRWAIGQRFGAMIVED